MIVTRGKLTVDQADRTATTARCVQCGESTTVLTAREHTAIDHRCGTAVAGPTWTIIERPRVPNPRVARAFERMIA